VSILLSIITVVKDDADGLRKTGISLRQFVDDSRFEWIVWINEKTVELKHHQYIANTLGAKVIKVGSDSGIFDAMYKSLKLARGKYVLFLNAKDEVILYFNLSDISEPCAVPVIYTNFFGKDIRVKLRKSVRRGIPYCHQGLILPRKTLSINPEYKFGADYLSLLDANVAWPPKVLKDGLIRFDSTGVSTNNRFTSDVWTLKIIHERFGFFVASTYAIEVILRIFAKRILSTIVKKR
jgi:putative colanic acid biosynthesis glycosyltransferase